MRKMVAASVLVTCAMLACAPARADWVPAFKGNDTGGIIAYTLASQADARLLAIEHCASYGKVVKFLPGIMGKNWLHLRDGSGARANGDDDITVTTGDSAAVGDVVLVRGTVRIDKDFGAGYRYAVMVEEAKVSK